MIIFIGVRVNSKRAIKFRTWVNEIIKDYFTKFNA
ncbi:MAG: virulence RhuM family protein [Firmicutes bacterium]|nr:virulence RhuM family protein [Bacillota bacterium]